MKAACRKSSIDKSRKTTHHTYGCILEYENLLKRMNEAE